MDFRSKAVRWAIVPTVVVTAVGTLALTATGTSYASAAHAAERPAAAKTSACGTKPGVKATGSPIVLGGIDTDQSGTSFTDIGNMAAAYFTCVNNNGGIDGHRIVYHLLTEDSVPSEIAAEAAKLVDTYHVVGVVGTSSIIECSVNDSYWAKHGYYVVAAGIASQCYGTPHYADVNMGPRFSSDGAAQYVISKGVKDVVFDQSNVPGTGYNVGGIVDIAKHAGVKLTQFTENVPISDNDAVAEKEVEAAGKDGAVVLNFTPPDALGILQAAQKLGLEDAVKYWACSTPCNTDFLAQELGPKWDHKFFVNAELADPDDDNSATMQLYKAIYHQYGKKVSGGIGAFSEMGFTIAEITVHALEQVKGAYTKASVNAAIKAVHDYNTGMNCQLWTYGSYSSHIANNEDYTVTPDNGKMVLAQGCHPISAVDPLIAQYRKQAGLAPLAPGQ